MFGFMKRLFRKKAEEKPLDLEVGKAVHSIAFSNKEPEICGCSASINWWDKDEEGMNGLIGKEPRAVISLRERIGDIAAVSIVKMEGRTMAEFKKGVEDILNGYVSNKGIACSYKAGKIRNEVTICRVGGGYPKVWIRWTTGVKGYSAGVHWDSDTVVRMKSEKGESLETFEARVIGHIKRQHEIAEFREKAVKILEKKKEYEAIDFITDESILFAIHNGASPETYVAGLLF